MVGTALRAFAHLRKSAIVSERTGAVAQQAILEHQRVAEGRHFAADDDDVVRRPRQGRDALVPDLAEAGILPADQMERGLGGAGDGKSGKGNAGEGGKGGKKAHGWGP